MAYFRFKSLYCYPNPNQYECILSLPFSPNEIHERWQCRDGANDDGDSELELTEKKVKAVANGSAAVG